MITGGAYDGASRFDHEVALWSPSKGSADAEILPQKDELDARTRDMVRNDAYVSAGAKLYQDGIVGGEYTLNSRPSYMVLGLDETWANEFQEEVEANFSLWAESSRCWPDAQRVNTFTELIRLAVGVWVSTGEFLAAAENMRNDGRPFRTAIQPIDIDRLSNPPLQMFDQNVRGGVRRDRFGAPMGYYIRRQHPADWMMTMDRKAYEWRYVPARRPWGRSNILHIYDTDRPDQSRGVSQMVAALKELKITKKFRDIVLQNAVVNATYAASIESELPSDVIYQAMGGGTISEAVAQKAIEGYAGGYLNSIAQYAGSAQNLTIDGVKIPHLYPGTKLQLHPAGQGGPLGTEFEMSLLRYIAATLGVSYEQLSKDYTQTTYSSARASMNETWKTFQARKKTVADRVANWIYMLWLEEAIETGQITSMPRNAPAFYEGMNAEAYSAADWIGASRGQIDELKETEASIMRLQNNLSTYEDEAARLGKDWRKLFRQRAREKAMMDELGLQEGQDSMIEENTEQTLRDIDDE